MALTPHTTDDLFAPVPVQLEGAVTAGQFRDAHTGIDAWALLHIMSAPAPTAGTPLLRMGSDALFVMPDNALIGPFILPPNTRIAIGAVGTTNVTGMTVRGTLSAPWPMIAAWDTAAFLKDLREVLREERARFLPQLAAALRGLVPSAPSAGAQPAPPARVSPVRAGVHSALGPGSLIQPSGLRAQAKGR